MNNIGRWVAVLLAAALPCVVWANPISLEDLLWPSFFPVAGIFLLQAPIAVVEALAYSKTMKDEFSGWMRVSVTANLTSYLVGLAVLAILNLSSRIESLGVVLLLNTSVAIMVEVPLIVLLTWKFWSRERLLMRVVWMVALVNLVSCSTINAMLMAARATA